MSDTSKVPLAELEASVERLIGYDRREQLRQVLDESLVDWANVRELVRRHRTLEAAAIAYVDRTANNSARDSRTEWNALVACLPPLGPLVWDKEKGHYVRLPAP